MAEAIAPQTWLVVTPEESSTGGSLNVLESVQQDTTGRVGSQSALTEANGPKVTFGP